MNSNTLPLGLLSREKKALNTLVAAHILIIAASNYLVQIEFEFLGILTTWGAFTFPFIFLATDLTVRIFGANLARRIIFGAMLPALLVSYLVSVLFKEGELQNISVLSRFDTVVFRIAVASFFAYVFGQLVDVKVFNRFRRNRSWWVAPLMSTIVGNALDATLFFFIAFYRSSDAFMSEHWIEIAWADYATRMIISLLFFLPAYGVILNRILSRISTQHK